MEDEDVKNTSIYTSHLMDNNSNTEANKNANITHTALVHDTISLICPNLCKIILF